MAKYELWVNETNFARKAAFKIAISSNKLISTNKIGIMFGVIYSVTEQKLT